MKAQTVSIIGLDVVGVSIGLALRRSRLGVIVIGHDKDAARSQEAKKIEAIDKSQWNLVSAAAAADILILTLPISEVEETLRAIGHDVRPHALVLDLASLKGLGLAWAQKYLQSGHYVGVRLVFAAASLADGRTELEAAHADLFREGIFCLMPSPKAEPKAVETAVNLGLLLGAKPFFIDAEEYDSLIQGVETTPGLMAAAFFRAVTNSSGWRDILRFAGRPFAMSTLALGQEDLAQLALYDRAATLRWLDALLAELQGMRRWIAQGDSETLSALLETLAAQRENWLRDRAQNEWTEHEAPEIERVSMSQHFFGGLARRKEKKD